MNIATLAPFTSIIITGDKKELLDNRSYRSKFPKVEFSTKAFLRKKVKTNRQLDRDCTQSV
jgi:hypothetical protein